MADDVPVDSGPGKATDEEVPKTEEPSAPSPAEGQMIMTPKEEVPGSPGASGSSPAAPKRKITVHVKTPKEKESFEVDEDFNVKEVHRMMIFVINIIRPTTEKGCRGCSSR